MKKPVTINGKEYHLDSAKYQERPLVSKLSGVCSKVYQAKRKQEKPQLTKTEVQSVEKLMRNSVMRSYKDEETRNELLKEDNYGQLFQAILNINLSSIAVTPVRRGR